MAPPKKGSNRRHARSELRVKAKLTVRGERRTHFDATLPTRNISLSGVFLESSYFLKVGQSVELELRVPPQDRVVQLRCRVVRVETSGRATNGFALKFEDYLGNSELVLKSFLLDPVLRDFVVAYAKKNDVDTDEEYLTHVVDLLAEWEFTRNAGAAGERGRD
jgi:hypothetical protein